MTDTHDKRSGLFPSERFNQLMEKLNDPQSAETIADALFAKALAHSRKTGAPMPSKEDLASGLRWAMLLQVLDERLGRAPTQSAPVPALGMEPIVGPPPEFTAAAGANGPAGPTGASST